MNTDENVQGKMLLPICSTTARKKILSNNRAIHLTAAGTAKCKQIAVPPEIPERKLCSVDDTTFKVLKTVAKHLMRAEQYCNL